MTVTQTRFYTGLGLGIGFLVIALVWYFFGPTIIQWSGGTNTSNLTEQGQNETQATPALNKEEQREKLDELLPVDTINTEAEIQQEVQLLEQLQQDADSDVENQLNLLRTERTVEAELDLLKSLE